MSGRLLQQSVKKRLSSFKGTPNKKCRIVAETSKTSRGGVCIYCNRPEPGESETLNGGFLLKKDVFGKFGSQDQTYAHYCCLYFSRDLKQQDEPTMDGTFGFRPQDILKNIQKFRFTTCCFCKQPNAASGCARCKVNFHFSCGAENGVMFDYVRFRAFCGKHQKIQKANASTAAAVNLPSNCLICQDDVLCEYGFEQFQVPCCKRWFHRNCLQGYAFSAASHHIKCPLCNDVDAFKSELIQFGFHIPVRDAAWERDPEAYRSLYEIELRCTAPICICPKGTQFPGGPRTPHFEFLVCSLCGGNSAHRSCTDTAALCEEWVCFDCKEENSSDDVFDLL